MRITLFEQRVDAAEKERDDWVNRGKRLGDVLEKLRADYDLAIGALRLVAADARADNAIIMASTYDRVKAALARRLPFCSRAARPWPRLGHARARAPAAPEPRPHHRHVGVRLDDPADARHLRLEVVLPHIDDVVGHHRSRKTNAFFLFFFIIYII
jgi:hypothetical protein